MTKEVSISEARVVYSDFKVAKFDLRNIKLAALETSLNNWHRVDNIKDIIKRRSIQNTVNQQIN